MATTIQVAEATLHELQAIKRELGVASYDEAVRKLLMSHRKRRDYLVGLTPGIGRFVRARGERD